jgi:predicted DNA-binding transcriptional regulator YafY
MKRIDRLTAILTILQSKRIVTSQEIADKFGVTIRTIYRDIRSLEESGVPVVTEEGKGYSLMEGFTVPPIMFTEEEANALITAEQLIQKNNDSSLIHHYQNAILKVKSVLRRNMKEKAELLSGRISLVQNDRNKTTSDVLSEIQLAITNSKTLKIEYTAANSNQMTLRTIEPLALYNTQGNWILIAYCRLRKEEREFRTDRISSLHSGDQFTPRKFEFDNYFRKQILKYSSNP